MDEDIVEFLRRQGRYRPCQDDDERELKARMNEAADEIERLREGLKNITSRGHAILAKSK